VEGCAPLCVAFAATDQLVDMIYTWDFGDGNTGEGWTAAHCYTEGGDHDVTLTVTDDTGCSGSSVQPDLVHVWPQPTAVFTVSATTVTTEHATIQFTDQSTDAVQWVWHFGDAAGSFATEPSPAFTFTEVGCFTVSLVTASDQGCTATDSTEICVEDPYAVYVPNAFTPNGDDINDVFGLMGSVRVPHDYQLLIFDRWGRELWGSSVPYQTWDGAGTPEGVYIWKLMMRDTDGKLHEHLGHVALIR